MSLYVNFFVIFMKYLCTQFFSKDNFLVVLYSMAEIFSSTAGALRYQTIMIPTYKSYSKRGSVQQFFMNCRAKRTLYYVVTTVHMQYSPKPECITNANLRSSPTTFCITQQQIYTCTRNLNKLLFFHSSKGISEVIGPSN